VSASVVADVATRVVHGHIVIRAPRERVFAALTDPRQLASWWGSEETYRTSDWVVDLRPGGAWSCQAEGARGRSTVRGAYRVVEPPSALELTWEPSWEGFATTTIRYELDVVPEGTRVRIRHWGFATSDACEDHARGWTRVFGWLAAWLDGPEA